MEKRKGRERREFRHFSRILDNGTDLWKYASFEGVQIAQNPWFYRHLSLKKALVKSAILGKSREKKGRN